MYNRTLPHLIHCIVEVLVDIALGIDGVGLIHIVRVILQEEMFKRHRVLLLKLHNHLITETKQDELQEIRQV